MVDDDLGSHNTEGGDNHFSASRRSKATTVRLVALVFTVVFVTQNSSVVPERAADNGHLNRHGSQQRVNYLLTMLKRDAASLSSTVRIGVLPRVGVLVHGCGEKACSG